MKQAPIAHSETSSICEEEQNGTGSLPMYEPINNSTNHLPSSVHHIPNPSPSTSLRGACLSFRHVSYTVKLRQFPWRPWEHKTVLNDLSGIMKPGLNAILGGSGCGKTSLLDALAARKDPHYLKGDILMDGKPRPANFRCISGYVLQDDILMGSLTVKESLLFSAALRLPNKKHSEKQRRQRVVRLLDELGLTHVANSKIGTQMIRGISGGERKRTSIGMELVMDPPVLFLDEPTTGLDASTAQVVMNMLKDMSNRGKTIIFSIHQPKYSIYKLFTSITLLCQGQMVYHGPAGTQLLTYFRQHGYMCEPYDNPADFVLDVLNGIDPGVNTIHDEGELLEKEEVIPDDAQYLGLMKRRSAEVSQCFIEKWKQSPLCEQLQCDLAVIMKKWLSKQQLSSSEKSFEESPDKNGHEHPSKGGDSAAETGDSPESLSYHAPPYINSFFTQLRHVGWRSCLNVVRDPQIWVMQSALFLFLAITMGIFFFQMDLSREAGIQNRMGLFFLSTLQMVFINLAAVDVFIRDRHTFIHETSRGFYRTSVYFLCKLCCEQIPAKSVPLALCMPITYFMTALRHSPFAVLVFELTLVLVNLASCGVALLVSASVTVLGLAQICISITFVTMMVFSGYLINLSAMGWWLSWVRFLSIFRYAIAAMAVNEMSELEFCTQPQFHQRHLDLLRQETLHITTSNSPNGSVTRGPFGDLSANATSRLLGVWTNATCEPGGVYLATQDIPNRTAWDLWNNLLGLMLIALATCTLTYVQLRRVKKYM